MKKSGDAAKKVLIVKESINFDSFPSEGLVWLDELSRGLLSQSSYYLKKNSTKSNPSVLSFLPKNAPFDQVYVINQEDLPSKNELQSALIEGARCYYRGNFNSNERELLSDFFCEMTEWK